MARESQESVPVTVEEPAGETPEILCPVCGKQGPLSKWNEHEHA